MGRAGKATGKHKNWFNLQYSEPVDIAGTMRSADLTQVEDLQVDPLDNVEVCSDVHENDVLVTVDVLILQNLMKSVTGIFISSKRVFEDDVGPLPPHQVGVHQVGVYTKRRP